MLRGGKLGQGVFDWAKQMPQWQLVFVSITDIDSEIID